ncbi:basic leucine zipper protein [Zalerion maritima]|uniref:Basic leucine zipper protein n=1 Tax=Zalerion maritima TaxID=339359 RepID=A0AAD5WT41_9PEZI|nr:basic leucine zipper protein [Zalerion maritima]
MPRNGEGHIADNAVEAGHNIVHGAGDANAGTHVDRADKTAPLPETEKGQALEGMNASGGQSQGLAKGPDAGQGGRGSSN